MIKKYDKVTERVSAKEKVPIVPNFIRNEEDITDSDEYMREEL